MVPDSTEQPAQGGEKPPSEASADGSTTQDTPRAAAKLVRWIGYAFSIATAVSFVLCVAIAGLWIRSYSVQDEVKFGRGLLANPRGDVLRTFQARSQMGSVTLWRMGLSPPGNRPPPVRGPRLVTDGAWGVERTTRPVYAPRPLGYLVRQSFQRPRFMMDRKQGPMMWMAIATFPHWFAVVATAVLPFSWSCGWLWRRVRRRGWLRAGLCPSCGYDLRASKDRCPECGTPIPDASGRPELQPKAPEA